MIFSKKNNLSKKLTDLSKRLVCRQPFRNLGLLVRCNYHVERYNYF